jgi:hypothetical protein
MRTLELKAKTTLLLDNVKIHISIQLSHSLRVGRYERTSQTELTK